MARITDILWQLWDAVNLDQDKLKKSLDTDFWGFKEFAEQIVKAILALKEDWTIDTDQTRELLQKVSDIKDNYELENSSQNIEMEKSSDTDQSSEVAQPQQVQQSPQPQQQQTTNSTEQQQTTNSIEQQLANEQEKYNKIADWIWWPWDINASQVAWWNSYDKLLADVAQQNYTNAQDKLGVTQEWISAVQTWANERVDTTARNIAREQSYIDSEYAPWGRLERKSESVWTEFNQALAGDAMKRQAQLRTELGDKLWGEQSRQVRQLLAEDNQRTAIDRAKVSEWVYNNVRSLADQYQNLRWQIFNSKEMNAEQKLNALKDITERQDALAEMERQVKDNKLATETSWEMWRLASAEQARANVAAANIAWTDPQTLKNSAANYVLSNWLKLSPVEVQEIWRLADAWDSVGLSSYLSEKAPTSGVSAISDILNGGTGATNVWTSWQASWLGFINPSEWWFDWKWLVTLEKDDNWVEYIDITKWMDQMKWKWLIPIKPVAWTYAGDNYNSINLWSEWTKGIDFDDATTWEWVSNAKAVSPWTWTIVATDTDDLWGNTAVVEYDIPWGWKATLRFSHLADFDKKVWDTVALWDSIWTIGSTGNSTGTHLDVTWYAPWTDYNNTGNAISATDTMRVMETMYQKWKQDTVWDITWWDIIPWSSQTSTKKFVEWKNIYDDLLSIWDTLSKEEKAKSSARFLNSANAWLLWLTIAWLQNILTKDFKSKVEAASDDPNSKSSRKFIDVEVPTMIEKASSGLIDDFKKTIDTIKANTDRINKWQWSSSKLASLWETNKALVSRIQQNRDTLKNLVLFLKSHYWENNSYLKDLNKKIKVWDWEWYAEMLKSIKEATSK